MRSSQQKQQKQKSIEEIEREIELLQNELKLAQKKKEIEPIYFKLVEQALSDEKQAPIMKDLLRSTYSILTKREKSKLLSYLQFLGHVENTHTPSEQK